MEYRGLWYRYAFDKSMSIEQFHQTQQLIATRAAAMLVSKRESLGLLPDVPRPRVQAVEQDFLRRVHEI